MTGKPAVSRRLLGVLVAAVALGGFTAQRSLTGETGTIDAGFDGPSGLPWSGPTTPIEPVPWEAPKTLRNPFVPSGDGDDDSDDAEVPDSDADAVADAPSSGPDDAGSDF